MREEIRIIDGKEITVKVFDVEERSEAYLIGEVAARFGWKIAEFKLKIEELKND